MLFSLSFNRSSRDILLISGINRSGDSSIIGLYSASTDGDSVVGSGIGSVVASVVGSVGSGIDSVGSGIDSVVASGIDSVVASGIASVVGSVDGSVDGGGSVNCDPVRDIISSGFIF